MLSITPLLIAAALLYPINATPPAVMQAPAAATTPAVTAPPASPAAEEVVPSFNASDLDALRPNVGKTVEITGTPTGSGHSKTGSVLYLNFAGAHKGVALVFFVSGGAAAGGADTGAKKAQTEDDIKPFVGKVVSVKGKLADYKGDLQIVINTLDQIKVKE